MRERTSLSLSRGRNGQKKNSHPPMATRHETAQPVSRNRRKAATRVGTAGTEATLVHPAIERGEQARSLLIRIPSCPGGRRFWSACTPVWGLRPCPVAGLRPCNASLSPSSLALVSWEARKPALMRSQELGRPGPSAEVVWGLGEHKRDVPERPMAWVRDLLRGAQGNPADEVLASGGLENRTHVRS